MNTKNLSDRSVSNFYPTLTPGSTFEVSVQWSAPLRKGTDGFWLVSITLWVNGQCNLSEIVSYRYSAGTSRYSEKLLLQFAKHMFSGLVYDFNNQNDSEITKSILALCEKHNLVRSTSLLPAAPI